YHHVDEDAFKRVAEEVSHRDLNAFFAQWLHTTELYDYALGRVRHQRLPNGSWRTKAEVLRKAPGMIPVEVAFISGTDTTVVRTDGFATSAWVEAVTPGRPDVVVDPRERTHDWNLLNNTAHPRTRPHLDTFFSEQSPRDALGLGIAPVAWFNDAGGLTLGARTRENYLDRFDLNTAIVSYGTGAVGRLDFAFRWKNPTFLQAPGMSQSLEAFSVEGREGARLAIARTRQDHLGVGPTVTDGITVDWVHARDSRFLDPARWQLGGTVEAGVSHSVSSSSGAWHLTSVMRGAAGIAFTQPGVPAVSGTRYDLTAYARLSIEGTARRALGRFDLALRGFAGATVARDSMPRQALFYLNGAGPYEELQNPFLRSKGALLVGQDMNYQMPGEGNMRGMSRSVAAHHLASLGAEVSRAVLSRPRGGLFNNVQLAAFGDLGVADGDLARGSRHEFKMVTEAGVGVHIRHRIGQTNFVTRFDFPLFVGVPGFAQDDRPGYTRLGFRWLFSFEPGI
ncbi:MAG: hypothetical protein ACREL2_01005, partial [Gemmatimonadales bacterium]